MPFQIAVPEVALSFPCRDDQTVLGAMIQAGASALQVGCRGGGCGVCRVQVLEGRYETGTMSHAQVGQADRDQGIVLSCQLFPRSDLSLRALGRAPGANGKCATTRLLRNVMSSSCARAA
ncbi:MAG: ferredoxin [Panacagrimonas sp.]|jgi:ferredoxin|nr:2Fe-2S iron-sulfur cluster-binding protein [Panacagrimonas sp.]MCC2657990.1 ferredoxin [Panacagrimonas sp.]